MDPNSFQPQGKGIPQGALPVSIRPPGGPQLGQHFAVGVQPGQQQAIQAAPGPQPQFQPQQQQQMQQAFQPQQMQAQISAPSMPKGAQPVPLLTPQLAGALAPAPTIQHGPPVPQRQQFAPQHPALAQAPQPQHQLNGTEVVPVAIEGLGPDGRKYTAEFDAVFPAGTKILGVRY